MYIYICLMFKKLLLRKKFLVFLGCALTCLSYAGVGNPAITLNTLPLNETTCETRSVTLTLPGDGGTITTSCTRCHEEPAVAGLLASVCAKHLMDRIATEFISEE